MGRRRSKHLNLPPRLHLKAGGYYHVSSALPRKWTPLGNDLAIARVRWAHLEGTQDSGLMGAAIDKYLAEELKDLAENTRGSYTQAAIPLRKVFGNIRHEQIKKHHVYSYRDKHKHKMSANLEIGVLKNIFRAMNKWGWTENNPCIGVKRHKVKKRERYLEDAEYLAIRNHPKTPDYVRAAMDIAYCLASRRSDVSKIHLSDIKDDVLMVVQMKTGKKQPFTITPMLSAAIERAKALPRPVRGLWLFCRRDGQPYKASTISGAFGASAKRAGILETRFHDVRAKSATDAKTLGMDFQALLGHASIVTSENYVRPRKADRVTPLSRSIL